MIPLKHLEEGSQRFKMGLSTYKLLNFVRLEWKNHPKLGCLIASCSHQVVKNLPARQETQIQFLGEEDSLEKGMAIHSDSHGQRIPWTEEPGRLESMGLQRVNTCLLCNELIFSGPV